jgi:hypothetical protein
MLTLQWAITHVGFSMICYKYMLRLDVELILAHHYFAITVPVLLCVSSLLYSCCLSTAQTPPAERD